MDDEQLEIGEVGDEHRPEEHRGRRRAAGPAGRLAATTYAAQPTSTSREPRSPRRRPAGRRTASRTRRSTRSRSRGWDRTRGSHRRGGRSRGTRRSREPPASRRGAGVQGRRAGSLRATGRARSSDFRGRHGAVLGDAPEPDTPGDGAGAALAAAASISAPRLVCGLQARGEERAVDRHRRRRVDAQAGRLARGRAPGGSGFRRVEAVAAHACWSSPAAPAIATSRSRANPPWFSPDWLLNTQCA